MESNDEIAQELKFAYLKYIQMAEDIGFLPTDEHEEGFNSTLTAKQLEKRYNNEKKWYRANFGNSKLYKLINGNSSDLNKLKKILEKQDFPTDRVSTIINLLRD